MIPTDANITVLITNATDTTASSTIVKSFACVIKILSSTVLSDCREVSFIRHKIDSVGLSRSEEYF